MSKLYVLVGIPASGKSHYTKSLTNTVIISSDSLREELFGDIDNQDNNDKVFAEMYKRAKNWLKSSDVFLDSTNISAKKRIAIIKDFRKHADEIIAVYFNTPYEQLIGRNRSRSRKVPHHVIDRMYKTLQIPTYAEGWDDIKIVDFYQGETCGDSSLRDEIEVAIKSVKSTHESLFSYIKFLDEFHNIYNLPQDNPHHTFSVSMHTYYVWKDIVDNYTGENERDKLVMLWTALFHDVGKRFCKEFVDGKRYASFIGHENVSAQLACDTLIWLNYDLKFVLEVVELVQNHMKLLSIGDSEKGQKKLLDFVGEKVYNKLVRFRDADTNAK